MAFIKSVTVKELATRQLDRTIRFNRDVNVFFGANGSGKTSLLRIIEGALSGRIGHIKSVPFASASVVIDEARIFNPVGEDFYGEVTRETLTELPPQGMVDRLSEYQIELFRKTERGGKKVWYAFEPKGVDQSFQIRHVYLPISRLFINDDRRLPRSFRDANNSALITEASIEKFFVDMVNLLWLRYTRNTSLEIQDAQSRGLSEILADFLSPDPDGLDDEESSYPDVEEAYRKLQTFLSRQEYYISSFEAIHPETFAERLRNDKRMRRVLRYIGQVERHVEELRKPSTEFDYILKHMISPGKEIKLGDRDIHAFANSEEIGLDSLSSGEKQLIRICVEAILADGDPVLIDEPELSMHIDWQRELIPAIRALAPDSQLIIATHSPEIMAPLPNHQIFEL